MKNSQLIELIKTLKPAEKEHILQFAMLPFFNQGRMRAQVSPLLELCLKHDWQDTTVNLEKTTVFASIFPNQIPVEGKLEKVMVEAHRVVRSFLLTQHYFREGNEFHQAFDTAEIIRMRGLYTRYHQSLDQLKKMQKESKWENANNFHCQFLLEYAIHEDDSYHNRAKGDLNVPDSIHALEQYYNFNRLKLLNTLQLQQKITKVEVPSHVNALLEKILVPGIHLEESPSIIVNYAIFSTLKKQYPAPSDVREFFDLLLLHGHKFESKSLSEYHTYLRNICVLAITNNPDFEETYFTLHELYKDNLERGYLHYEGKLHPSKYWAVSSNAIRVKKHDWALEFIEKYKNEIIGENKTRDIYRLNFANYLFAVGRFDECLDFIPDYSPYIDYLIYAKRLELKTYYELRSDLLDYRLSAFKMFLSRTSHKLMSDSFRQMNLDFANLLHLLIASRPGDQIRAEIVIGRVEEKRKAAEWGWLNAKANDLMKRPL